LKAYCNTAAIFRRQSAGDINAEQWKSKLAVSITPTPVVEENAIAITHNCKIYRLKLSSLA
jgi:hypothetical protein